jgi:hypothetical protein
MGGLLDKANEYSDSVHQGDNVSQKVVNEPSAIIDAYEKGKQAGNKESKTSKPAKAIEAKLEPETFSGFEKSSSADDKIQKSLFQSAGVVGLLATLGMVFFYGGTTFWDDLFIPGILVWWLVFNGHDLKSRQIIPKHLVATGLAFLVVSGSIAGVSIFMGGSSAPTISEISFDDESNDLRIALYGSSGTDFHLEIQDEDGVVLCSADDTIQVDKVTVSMPLSECWNGNAYDEDGKEVNPYTVVATSGGNEDRFTIPAELVSREVTGAVVRAVELFEAQDGSENTFNHYTGLDVGMAVGILEMEDYSMNNGFYDGDTPFTITADWDATVVVYYGAGGSEELVAEISAEEGIAGGFGDFISGWVRIDANLDRDTFYDEDGCYTFEVTITNEVTGTTMVDDRSQIYLSWESNEADEDSGNDDMATTC